MLGNCERKCQFSRNGATGCVLWNRTKSSMASKVALVVIANRGQGAFFTGRLSTHSCLTMRPRTNERPIRAPCSNVTIIGISRAMTTAEGVSVESISGDIGMLSPLCCSVMLDSIYRKKSQCEPFDEMEG